MKKAEAAIRHFLREHIRAPNPVGLIECDGRGSFAGQFEAGDPHRSSYDFASLLDQQREIGEDDFTGDFIALIKRLHEESRAHICGPFYRIDIKLDGEIIDLDYSWERESDELLDEPKQSVLHEVPRFVLEQRFDEKVIAHIDDKELDTAVSVFVKARRQQNAALPESLLDMHALMNWHLMAVSEGFEEHFSNLDSGVLHDSPVGWYKRVIRQLTSLEQKDTIDLIELSIGMYASVYEAVETIRSSLGIDPVARVDEDLLYDRLGAVEHSLPTVWRQEVKKNPARYAVSD